MNLQTLQGSSDSTHGVAISLNRCSTGTREQARGRTCILTDNRRASKIWSLRSTGQSNQGVTPKYAATEGEAQWQFQRENRRQGQQQQPRDQIPGQDPSFSTDQSQRSQSHRSASTSQPSQPWQGLKSREQGVNQHSSWDQPEARHRANGRQRNDDLSRSSGPGRGGRKGPTRESPSSYENRFAEDDDIWDIPGDSSSRRGTAPWSEDDGRPSVPSNGGSYNRQGGGRPSTQQWRGRQADAQPSDSRQSQRGGRWNGDSGQGQPRAMERQNRRAPLRRGQGLDYGNRQDNGSRDVNRRPSQEHEANREPWKAMSGGQEGRDLDRKARVRVAIACNRITLTAYEQFRVEEQAAGRMADRQEALQEFIYKLEDTINGNEGCMDTINVSGALQKLAAACCLVTPVGEALFTAQRLFQKLIGLALNLQGSFKIDAINITIGALARLSVNASNNLMPPAGSDEALNVQVLLEGFAVRAWNRLSEPPAPEAHQLSLLIWGYSRLQLDPLGGKLFNLVVQKAEPVISQFDSQNVSNFLLAAATLEKPLPEDFLDRIARQATLKMPQASPQGISNLLWAYAKLTKVSPLGGDLFRSALSRASEVMEDFTLQNVANLFWAAVQFGQPLSPRMLSRLAAAAHKRLESANPITIAGLLMSYAKMEAVSGHEPLFLACVLEVDKKLEQCNAQTLSNLIWSLGSVKATLPAAMLHRLDEAWADRALALLDGLWGQKSGWAQNVSNILWGYSQLRLDPLQGRFFQNVLSRLDRSNLTVMEPGNTNSILMAAASMQRKSFTAEFLNSALSQILAEGSMQEICNTMWSLTALGLLRQTAMASLVQQLIKTAGGQPLHPFSARQLLMAHAILTSHGKADTGTEIVPQGLLEECRAIILEHSQPAYVSGFHEEVSQALESMGVPHAVEFSSPDGLMSIDIVARCGDGSPLAIEVDGDEHFTQLPPYRPLGHTTIRNQMIAALGFRGVGIPYYDWQGLPSPADKVSYVTARMAKWGIAPT